MFSIYFYIAANYSSSLINSSEFSDKSHLHKEAIEIAKKIKKFKYSKTDTLSPLEIMDPEQYKFSYTKEEIFKISEIVKLIVKDNPAEDFFRIEKRLINSKVLNYYSFYNIVLFNVLKQLNRNHFANVRRFFVLYVKVYPGFGKYLEQSLFIEQKKLLKEMMKNVLREYIYFNNIFRIRQNSISFDFIENNSNIITLNLSKIFQLLINEIDKDFEKLFKINIKGYYNSYYHFTKKTNKDDSCKGQISFFLYVNERIFSSNDFKALLKLSKTFILIKNMHRMVHSETTPAKSIHYMLTVILLNFKSVVYLLFGDIKTFFTQKYLPRYKVVILNNLKYRLEYFMYILFENKGYLMITKNEHKKLKYLLIYHICKTNGFQIPLTLEKKLVEIEKKLIF